MISWDDILKQYCFENDSYDECLDPSELTNYFVDVIPNYPFPTASPNLVRMTAHSYRNVLLLILPSEDYLYDFPVSVNISYLSSETTGRQPIYFSDTHSLLSLNNHSDFIKMHTRNDWLLEKAELNIDLPADFSNSPNHLFIFCGSLTPIPNM